MLSLFPQHYKVLENFISKNCRLLLYTTSVHYRAIERVSVSSVVQNSAWEGHIHSFGWVSGGVKWLLIWNWKLIPNPKLSIFWVCVGGRGQLVMKNFRFDFGSASNSRRPFNFTFSSSPPPSPTPPPNNQFRLDICNIWSNLRWPSVFTLPFQKLETLYLRHPTFTWPHPHHLQHWTGVKPHSSDIPARMFVKTSVNEHWFYCKLFNLTDWIDQLQCTMVVTGYQWQYNMTASGPWKLD